jgi:hypothetical protein
MTDISNAVSADDCHKPLLTASTREVLDHYRDLAVEESAKLTPTTRDINADINATLDRSIARVEKAIERFSKPSSAVVSREIAEHVTRSQSEMASKLATDPAFRRPRSTDRSITGRTVDGREVTIPVKDSDWNAIDLPANWSGDKSPTLPGETKEGFFKRLLTRLKGGE